MRLLIAASAVAAPAADALGRSPGDPRHGLTAAAVVEAMRAGWRRTAPNDPCDRLPLSDGGLGFLEAADAVLPAEVARTSVEVTVSGPRGAEHPAYLLLADEQQPTAYLDAAQICGPQLVPADRRDPGRSTTAGLGRALTAARQAGARRIVVGVDDTATNDAGAGLLGALGVGGELLVGGGSGLGAAGPADLGHLSEVVEYWREVDIVVATGSPAPLLGFGGASATGAVAKGATPEQAQALEAALGHFADVLQRRAPARADLLSGAPIRLDRLPGAGAGGGLGFALAVLGGRIVPAGRLLLDRPDVRRRIDESDLVVVGVDELDPFALRGTALATLCELAGELSVPVVALAGRAPAGRREAMSGGISGLYAMTRGFAEPPSPPAERLRAIEDWTARIARTWGRL